MKSKISLGEFLLKNSKYEVADKDGRRKFLTDSIVPISNVTSERDYNRLIDDELIPICERIKEADIKFTQILENVRTIGNDPTDKAATSPVYRDHKNVAISKPQYNSHENISYLYDLLAVCHFNVDEFDYVGNGEVVRHKQHIKRNGMSDSEIETLSSKSIDAIMDAEEAIENAEELITNFRNSRVCQSGTTKIMSYKMEACSYIPIWYANAFTIPRGRVCIDMMIVILIK